MQHTPPQQGGAGYSGKPDPTPPPCPDPCDQEPPKWGPPRIPDDCCPKRTCCPDAKTCCTWEDIDDPCLRATSCGGEHTIITCKCESSNKKCNPEVWECGCCPPGTCVPCKPCEDLIPDPTDPGGCDEPKPGDCTSEDLQKQLNALNQCIASQQGEKARIEADIKTRGERADALRELIKSFDGIIKKYKEQRYKLVCREDCLKGFHRDISEYFKKKYPEGHLNELKRVINLALCDLEKERCCQKNLEGKLTIVTKLTWKQQEAQKELDKANKAFEIIKDLPKWIEDRFKELEDLKEEIAKALNSTDPDGYKLAFYLFYWKFVPKLCKCFPFPFCCDETTPPPTTQAAAAPQNKPLDHLGCKPGDWHPSRISEEDVKALICCASESVSKKKKALQDINDRIADVNNNLAFIKKKAEDDAKTLEDRIKSAINRVEKPSPTST